LSYRPGSALAHHFPVLGDEPTQPCPTWHVFWHRAGESKGALKVCNPLSVKDLGTELRCCSGEYRTFCVQRLDRYGVRRRCYAFAMPLLRKNQSEGTSYLEFAEFLHARGATGRAPKLDGPITDACCAQNPNKNRW
jgi:hypothetical protein